MPGRQHAQGPPDEPRLAPEPGHIGHLAIADNPACGNRKHDLPYFLFPCVFHCGILPWRRLVEQAVNAIA
ncbi:hypothetical protein GCM10007071_17430 [Marinobacter zhanjiangensis]|uniref:Uncharacterized protein n=1 Tax=Marinobacter zhanjiangensis TaxID=578215 RepID=A0ABQ3AXG5_9GAMM|nr:hypothetical protein GCM10007071_17430 [Marinobacter zhanjiangensis]